MRKIFLAMFIALIVGTQNFCDAATVTETRFNDNEKIVYPVVQLPDDAVTKRINAKIFEEVQSFIKQMHYAAQYENKSVADMRMSYEVGSNEAGNTVILSLIVTESWYYEGAAHPATVKHALNFNTTTGVRMGIDYLTDVGEGIDKAELINLLEQKLVEHCRREGIYLFEEAVPLKNLPENFYWDENLHVHFIFQHYEVAPYSEGIIDVDIDK